MTNQQQPPDDVSHTGPGHGERSRRTHLRLKRPRRAAPRPAVPRCTVPHGSHVTPARSTRRPSTPIPGTRTPRPAQQPSRPAVRGPAWPAVPRPAVRSPAGQPYPGQPYAGQPGQPYLGQPYAGEPGQPYAGQPYAGQPGQPYAGQPYSPQPPAGGPRPKRSKVPLFILVGVVAVVIIAVIANLLTDRGTPTASPSATTSGSTVPAPQSADPASAVQGYLQSLSQGDAVTALSYAATVPADTSMLTNEVLAAGLQTTPISDIQVSKGSGASTFDTIGATYKLGDRVVTASFDVSKAGTAWRLEQVASPVAFTSLYPDQVALRVNGAPLTTDSATLFPGGYTVTADDTRYGVSHATFQVQSPQDRPDTYAMQLTLSKAGISKVRAAAQKKLSSCLKQRSLKPAGCGFASYLPGKNKPSTSTIRWTVTKGANAMKTLKPTVDVADPTFVRATVNLQLKVNLRSTNGIRWYGYSGVYVVRGELTANGVRITLG